MRAVRKQAKGLRIGESRAWRWSGQQPLDHRPRDGGLVGVTSCEWMSGPQGDPAHWSLPQPLRNVASQLSWPWSSWGPAVLCPPCLSPARPALLHQFLHSRARVWGPSPRGTPTPPRPGEHSWLARECPKVQWDPWGLASLGQAGSRSQEEALEETCGWRCGEPWAGAGLVGDGPAGARSEEQSVGSGQPEPASMGTRVGISTLLPPGPPSPGHELLG